MLSRPPAGADGALPTRSSDGGRPVDNSAGIDVQISELCGPCTVEHHSSREPARRRTHAAAAASAYDCAHRGGFRGAVPYVQLPLGVLGLHVTR